MSVVDTPPQGFPAVAGAELSSRAHELHRRAGELFGLYGRAADPPRSDESDTAYTRRVLSSAKRYSSQWAGVDFDRLPPAALPIAFKQIVDDGLATYRRSGPGCGGLREEVRTDSGRPIRWFYGDPEACWAPFKGPARRLIGWDTRRLATGPNAPGARRPVATVYSDGSQQHV